MLLSTEASSLTNKRTEHYDTLSDYLFRLLSIYTLVLGRIMQRARKHNNLINVAVNKYKEVTL